MNAKLLALQEAIKAKSVQAKPQHRLVFEGIASICNVCYEDEPRTRIITITDPVWYTRREEISLPYVQYYILRNGTLNISYSFEPVTGSKTDKVYFMPLPQIHSTGVCGICVYNNDIVRAKNDFWRSRFTFHGSYEGMTYCNKYLGGIDEWFKKTKEDPDFFMKLNTGMLHSLMKNYAN